jgi:Uma2 family endonuclease
MVGATKRHNRNIVNITSRLWEAARGGDCRVCSEGVKLRVADDVIYYPDVMVACGPEGEDSVVEDDPCLVVVVASPCTETTDRREKLAAYLIVAQERKWIERHFRAENGAWRRGDLIDEGRFPVPCPETELSLAEIYEGLEVT